MRPAPWLLPVPEVNELRELPREFDGMPPPPIVEQVRLSVDLARERRAQLQVVELDDPSASVWALFG